MPSPIGNFFIKTIVNSPLNFLLGASFAVITIAGHKTGRRFSTPINVKRHGDTWTVISMRSRTWWRNLRGGAVAQLRVGGKQVKVHGDIIETTTDVAVGLVEYFRQYPSYAKYFDIHISADGQPDPRELERVANDRIIIHLHPEQTA